MLEFWLLISAWASISGWLLSALDHLDVQGYACSLTVLAIGLILYARLLKQTGRNCPRSRRFRRAAPCLWLLLTLLILAGGLLYQPNNYDYLTYRFPRILNWWWEHRWHWIATSNVRMNYSAAGFEWLMMPLFVFFKTDRLFFWINLISWLLLPGLFFSVFRRLGISRRIAWWGMWLLPSGYCYVLQAGSAGNDSFATVYLLAALHYALKARETRCVRDVALSCLAAALLTGAKASNLPLLLPCMIALLPVLYILLRRPALLLICTIACAMASILPLTLLNQKYTGHWTGDPTNHSRMKLTDPVSGLIGNGLQMAVINLAPPVFPVASWWNKKAPELLPAGLSKKLETGFPRLSLNVGEIPMEEAAGVGLGVVIVLFTCVGWCLVNRRTNPVAKIGDRVFFAVVHTAGVVALLIYMAKMGSEAGPRILATYYPLLAGAVFFAVGPGAQGFVRTRAGRLVMLLSMASVLPALVLSPARPLLPLEKGMARLLEKKKTGALEHMHMVYMVYRHRADAMAGLRSLLPENKTMIGLLQTGDDPEISLWRPFGSRKVITVDASTTYDDLVKCGIKCTVVSCYALQNIPDMNLEKLQTKWRTHIRGEKELLLKVRRGPETWCVMEPVSQD